MGETTMIDPHFQKVFSLALGIKDPWYIKSLDMVPSAKKLGILEMRGIEGSRFSYNCSEELYPVHDTRESMETP